MKFVRRMIASLLVAIALILFVVAIVSWGQDVVGANILTEWTASFGLNLAMMSPLMLAILAGTTLLIAYIVDADTASVVVNAIGDAVSDVADKSLHVLNKAAKSLLNSPLVLVGGAVGLWLLFKDD